MKGKKLLSMLTAGALAVTMVMPVMAADDGDDFNVSVGTKTGVVRVQVPTSMAIAVDQFEITHTGTQITAGEFNMTNKSEMDVKVTITSTATPGTGVNLVSTAKAAEDSTGADAWLGVAAKTNDGSGNSGKEYDDLKTGDATTSKVEEFWELSDANANVTSFAADTKKAEQTFYLAKGTGSATYNLAVPDAATQAEKTFAKFYELTADANVTDGDTLKTEVAAKDVYAVLTADIAKDGASVTKIAKGTAETSIPAYDSNSTYYTAADDASTPATGKKYVYASMATDGGKAGFTYIGKLGGKETWTGTDIGVINVAYKIAGVTGTRYNEVVNDCTYGLYAEPCYLSSKTLNATSLTVTMTLPTDVTVTKAELVDGSTRTALTLGNTYTINGTTLGIKNTVVTNNLGKQIVVTYSDGHTDTLAIQQ